MGDRGHASTRIPSGGILGTLNGKADYHGMMIRKVRLRRFPGPCVLLLATACSAWAQSGGFGAGAAADPFAVTGAASGMATSGWRPWLSVNGNYVTTVNDSQQLGDLAPATATGGGGLGGFKNWNRKTLAYGYNGTVAYNPSSSNLSKWRPTQVATLSYAQQVSQRLKFSLSQLGGLTYGGYGVASAYGANGIPGSSGSGTLGADGSFGDPGINNAVDNEIFNGRSVFYLGTGSLSYLFSDRLAVTFSGGANLIRRNQGIRGTDMYNGAAELRYRLSRRATIGTGATYSASSYSNLFGNVKALFGHFGMVYQINASTSINLDGGVGKITSTFIGSVPLPPEIAEIIGASGLLVVQQTDSWSPSYNVTFTKRTQFGSFMAGANRGFSVGNGLVMAGIRDMAVVTFTRPLTPRIGVGINGSATHMSGRVGTFGSTETAQTGGNCSFRLVRGLNATANAGIRYVGVPSRSHRSDLFVGGGLVWSPGEQPFTF